MYSYSYCEFCDRAMECDHLEESGFTLEERCNRTQEQREELISIDEQVYADFAE